MWIILAKHSVSMFQHCWDVGPGFRVECFTRKCLLESIYLKVSTRNSRWRADRLRYQLNSPAYSHYRTEDANQVKLLSVLEAWSAWRGLARLPNRFEKWKSYVGIRCIVPDLIWAISAKITCLHAYKCARSNDVASSGSFACWNIQFNGLYSRLFTDSSDIEGASHYLMDCI